MKTEMLDGAVAFTDAEQQILNTGMRMKDQTITRKWTEWATVKKDSMKTETNVLQ